MGEELAQHSITITGNIINDPTFREWEDKAVYRMRVAASRASRDEQGTWTNYDQLFISVECWGDLARNCKLSLHRNVAVMVTGNLVTHEWKDQDGNSQSRIVLKATHIGVDLGRYVVRPMRASELDPLKQLEQNHAEADAPDKAPAETTSEGRVDEVIAEHEKELVTAGAGEEGGVPPF